MHSRCHSKALTLCAYVSHTYIIGQPDIKSLGNKQHLKSKFFSSFLRQKFRQEQGKQLNANNPDPLIEAVPSVTYIVERACKIICHKIFQISLIFPKIWFLVRNVKNDFVPKFSSGFLSKLKTNFLIFLLSAFKLLRKPTRERERERERVLCFT